MSKFRFDDMFRKVCEYYSLDGKDFYETKETYRYNADGCDFEYKCVVEISQFVGLNLENNKFNYAYEIKISLVVNPENLHPIVLYNIDCALCLDGMPVCYADIVEIGQGVTIYWNTVSGNKLSDDEIISLAEQSVEKVCSKIDLNNPWECITNEGWNIVERCLFNK